MFYHLRVLLLVLALSCPPLAFAEAEKILFAVDVIRHGDRTPIDELPKNPAPWPQGLGQLTPTGMQQEFHLGEALRKRYLKDSRLLPAQYQAETVYVRSSDFDRTLMSAEALLFGLYPLGSGPTLPQGSAALPSAYQPIPIHTRPQSEDRLLVAFSKNHKEEYEALLQKYVYSSPEWKAKTAELQPQFPHWSAATGINLTKLDQLISLGDTLLIRKIYQVPLPAGLTAADEQAIIAARHWAFAAKFRAPALGQYTGHPLLAVIATYLKQAAQHKTPLKWVLFSSHDSTILSLMSALGAPMETPPPYASDLNISLFETAAGEKRVKLSLNGQEVTPPGCPARTCTLAEFERLAAHDQ